MRFDRRLKKLDAATSPSRRSCTSLTAYSNDKWVGDYLAPLLNRAIQGAQTPQDDKKLDLIQRSVDGAEPGNGRMVELLLLPARAGRRIEETP